MISSMTGYAERKFDFAWGVIIWKLRSVNHRGSDINLRLPENLRGFELVFRQIIADHIERGRIDATLEVAHLDDAAAGRQPDHSKLKGLYNQAEIVRTVIPDARPLSVREVLSWPGIVADADFETDEITEQLKTALKSVLEELVQSRRSEGRGIRDFLIMKSAELKDKVAAARQMVPAAKSELAERLNDAVEKLRQEVDSQRVEQEIAMLLIKGDVAEELNRLELHLEEFERVLDAEAVVGRRLGFLAQELQREANTLGAKTAYYPLNALIVDAKVVIDQLREQTLNLE